MSRTDRKRLGSALWGMLIGAGIAMAIAACAAGKSAAPAMERRDPKDEIKEKLREISDWRVEQGLAREPSPGLIQNMRPIPFNKLRVCPDDPNPGTEPCRDVCGLKEKICENAEEICRIAGEIGDDAWANAKCDSAKASCKEATEKCCSCAAGEKSGQ
jgi:hypothetical protein